jgi:hypothetical protein
MSTISELETLSIGELEREKKKLNEEDHPFQIYVIGKIIEKKKKEARRK